MQQKDNDNIRWINAKELGIEGKGWQDTKNFFDRFPAKAQGVIRDVVWELSRSSSGITVHFQTGAPEIRAKWQLESSDLSMPRMSATGKSGLDLYARDTSNHWRWVGTTPDVSSRNSKSTLIADIEPILRQYMLYLPIFNPLVDLQIGIPKEYSINPVPARKAKPLVFYGTSIVHGIAASRPGMTYTSILGRRLDVPVINLGFSGHGHMEPEIANLLIELNPAVFVLDALPNMTAELVRERAEPFIRKICNAKPDIPIVLVEDRTYTNAWINTNQRKENHERRIEFSKNFKRLENSGITQLHYVKGEYLLGQDDDASVDGSHPSDLGFYRIANNLEPILRNVL